MNLCLYAQSCASSESNKCKANRAPRYLSVFRRKWESIFLMQKKCQIVCSFPRNWMVSTFLDHNVDVVFLANKSIVIECFVDKDYNKILTETGKLTDNIKVTKNGLGSGVDRMFKSSDSAFYHITDRLNPFGKSVEFDILFLSPLPDIHVTCIHGNIKVLVQCKLDRFPEFRDFL